MKTSTPLAVHGNQDLELNTQEKIELPERARHGDSKASMRLFMYYACVVGDRATALNWLRRAADDGDAAAQFNLGVLLLDQEPVDAGRREEALQWLRRAAASGNTSAEERLRKEEPNQALEPTPTGVTHRAAARCAPPAGVAHL